MDVMTLIAETAARRAASGLKVSFDRETPEETARFGRATRTVTTVEQRDACMARLAAKGRNPRIELT